MKVCLKSTPFYFLTTGKNIKRTQHMYNEFNDHNLIEVRPLSNDTISKFQSTASGFMKMIELGLQNQSTKNIFKPFVLLEDDVSKSSTFQDSITIPDNTDLFFIGLSSSSIGNKELYCVNCETIHHLGDFYITQLDDTIYKIKNMFSLHGVLVCTPTGANMLTKCAMEAYYKNVVLDVITSQCLSLYNVYAFNEPLVYQDETVDGKETQTKITIQQLNNLNFQDYPIQNTDGYVSLSTTMSLFE